MSCSLPERQTDLLEELLYVDLPQEQAQTLLQEYKDCARRLLPPVPRREKKKPRLHRKRPHPHGPPPSHRIQWTGMNGEPDKQCTLFWDTWDSLKLDYLFIYFCVCSVEQPENQHAAMESAPRICEYQSAVESCTTFTTSQTSHSLPRDRCFIVEEILLFYYNY